MSLFFRGITQNLTYFYDFSHDKTAAPNINFTLVQNLISTTFIIAVKNGLHAIFIFFLSPQRLRICLVCASKPRRDGQSNAACATCEAVYCVRLCVAYCNPDPHAWCTVHFTGCQNSKASQLVLPMVWVRSEIYRVSSLHKKKKNLLGLMWVLCTHGGWVLGGTLISRARIEFGWIRFLVCPM